MQIVLASAKIMNASTSVEVPMNSVPKFKDITVRFVQELASWDKHRLMKELGCSQAIAIENKLRYQSFWNEEERLPAILAYFGQAYKYLKAETFSHEDFRFAQGHLFIMSFLYGLLPPFDAIHPYRMEGKVKLEAAGGKNLFAFWKQYLTDMLIEAVKADDGILVHLATEEFEHIKVVSVHAKSCRGAMTRYIIQRRITRLTDMLSFESEGFRYDSRYGDELHPHFIRK